MAIAKVIYKASSAATPEVWMDTTQKTVTSATMLSNVTALKNDGTGVTGTIAYKTATNLTASGSTVTAASGYYSSAVSKSVSGGTATTPAKTITANPTLSLNSSTGVITGTVAASSSITPTIVSGYISAGTAGTVSASGSKTLSLTTVAAATIYPSTAQQTIASNRFLTGTQTFAPVTTVNLEASYIASGVTVKVGDAANASRISQVTGTFAGGGGGDIDYETWAQNTEVFTSTNQSIFSTISFIGDYALAGRHFSGTVSFNSVESIGRYAFYCSDSLPWSNCSLIFPICTSVGTAAFSGGRNDLYRLTMNSLETIPNYMCADCTNLYNINFQECTQVGSYAFYSCTRLSDITLPNCKSILFAAFEQTGTNAPMSYSISLPECTLISQRAFSGCTKLYEIYAPKCTSLIAYAFYSCTSLAKITLGNITAISSNCFNGCYSLSSIDLTHCKTIWNLAFANTRSLTTINAPVCTSIQNAAFSNAYVSYVDIPECEIICSGAFYRCYNLISISAPKCKTIQSSVFSSCYNLVNTNFDACEYVYSSAFYGCSSLQTISLPACISIYGYAFISCNILESVYLMGSSRAALTGTGVFTNTPIMTSNILGYFGSIYVPSSLLASYQTATNWTTYSSRIVGI